MGWGVGRKERKGGRDRDRDCDSDRDRDLQKTLLQKIHLMLIQVFQQSKTRWQRAPALFHFLPLHTSFPEGLHPLLTYTYISVKVNRDEEEEEGRGEGRRGRVDREEEREKELLILS